jgi:hypothetical protein
MRSLPTSTEAVVFDCDGLLVDTEACWTAAESAIFAAHGHPFGPEQKALASAAPWRPLERPWPSTSGDPAPAPKSPPNSSKESAKSFPEAPQHSPGRRNWCAPAGRPYPSP